jgi:hypothetical protein
MAKAQFKTRDGTNITIEGDPAEVAKIISQIQGGQTQSSSSPKATKASDTKREVKKQNTATDRIAGFREEGFFDKPKTLGEIKAELQKAGYLYPVTTLSGVMLQLLKKKLFTRDKSPNGWVYGNR